MMLRPGEDGAELYEACCADKAVREIIKYYGLPETPDSEKLALRIYYGPPLDLENQICNSSVDEWEIPF